MRWGRDRRAAGALASVAIALTQADARADGDPEPSHGRIEGDLSAVVGVGAAVAPRGVRAQAEVRLRYLESAGVFATYEDGPIWASGAEPLRVLALGTELRPLFLFRWLRGMESSLPWLDLTLDSLGFELGASWSQPDGGSFGSRGLEVGVGMETPLAASANGPWIGLHAGMRWSDHALSSGDVRGADDRSGYVAMTLTWHQTISAHLVDAGDRAPR